MFELFRLVESYQNYRGREGGGGWVKLRFIFLESRVMGWRVKQQVMFIICVMFICGDFDFVYLKDLYYEDSRGSWWQGVLEDFFRMVEGKEFFQLRVIFFVEYI